jgi:pimeloyl-ACP methyl ester carboxylesterase
MRSVTALLLGLLLVSCSNVSREQRSFTPTFSVEGEGPDIVFVHAEVLDQRMWGPQVDLLENDYRVLTYDRMGYGQSPEWTPNLSAVDRMRSLLAEADVSNAIFLGSSEGAAIALDYTLANPNLVQALILVNPRLIDFEPVNPYYKMVWNGYQRALAEKDVTYLSFHYLGVFWPENMPLDKVRLPPKWRNYTSKQHHAFVEREGFYEIPNLLESEPLKWMSRIAECPTLIIYGEHDHPGMVQNVRKLREVLPEAQYAEIPGAAHLPNLENTERFNEVLRSFLDGLPE